MRTRYTVDVSLRKKIQNIPPSWRAVVFLWKEEFSFKLQVIFAGLMVVVSFILNISRIEFIIVLLVIGAVLTTEALNTAIEELCDHVTPGEHPKIGKVKDLGSAASLLFGVIAIVIGLVIFIPHFATLLV